MSCKLGLAIGKSFAELTGTLASKDSGGGARVEPEPFVRTRWYLPKKNLADGLKEALRALPPEVKDGTLWVASHSVDRILERRQGKPPAVLVTTGFESWLPLSQPVISARFSRSATRESLPIEHDMVFGITERTKPDGTILTPVGREELEFIAAKLELLKIKDVAITLLNANSNAENENTVAAFLRDKGFRTNQSHLHRNENVVDRWRRTIEASFAEAAISEERDLIQEAIKAIGDERGGTWELFSWSPDGPRPWIEFAAGTARGGLDAALANSATHLKSTAVLHCGLDGLTLFTPKNTIVKQTFGTPVRLTQLVKHGEWPFPNFTDADSGYEPGPMLFGRSHQLAALDILHLQERLQEIEGLTPLISERSRPRILETLFTLAKSPMATSGDKRRPPDAAHIASELERALVEEIALEIAAAGVSDELTLTGAFASSLAPLISARRKDLRVKFNPSEAWRESAAALTSWRPVQ